MAVCATYREPDGLVVSSRKPGIAANFGRTHSRTHFALPDKAGIGRAGLAGNKCAVVPKDKKSKTAIYHPPKSGMPYLVVTVSPDGVRATAVASKHEARVIASKKTLNVEVEDATGETLLKSKPNL